MNALALPDIASDVSNLDLPLDWVGMCGIAHPVMLEGQRIAAYVDAGVSLDDSNARGIHMSRLYLALEELEREELSASLLHRVLQRFLTSHQELSSSASLTLHGEALLQRPALVSPLAGWKAYPFVVSARQDSWGFHVELQLQVAYSSTCPCSAALARQLIQQRFTEDFSGHPPGPGASTGMAGKQRRHRRNTSQSTQHCNDLAASGLRWNPGTPTPGGPGGSHARHRSADRGQARRRTGLRFGQWPQPDVL